MKEGVEWIRDGDVVLGAVVAGDFAPEQTSFLTPETYLQQLGFIVYPAGGQVVPHAHHPIERNIRGTSEVILVRKGRCTVDFYRDDHSLLASRELMAGDLVLLVHGGHGFQMIEPTILLEVKQGPFVGANDKVRFDRTGGPGGR